MTARSRGGRSWAPRLLACAAAAWCLLALLPPLLIASGHPSLALVVRAPLSPLCHQDPARSFAIAGYPLGVCARCTGLGAGLLIGSLVMMVPRGRDSRRHGAPPGAALMIAALPSVIEAIGERLAGMPPSGAARALLGALFAFVLVRYIVPALEELPEEARRELGRLEAFPSAWRTRHGSP